VSSPYINRFLQPDTLIPGVGNSQAWNRYSYGLNNPIVNNDPTGHCAEPITFLLCAAAIGAVVSVITDAYSTTVEHHESYSLEKAGQAVVRGAIVGVVGATIGLAGAAILGTGFLATVTTGVIAGAATGQATRAVQNKQSGKPITDGLGDFEDLLVDGVLGGAFAAVGYWIAKYSSGSNPNAYEHNYEYDNRVRERGIEDPVSHNFPYSFDDEILDTTPTIDEETGYKIFRTPGSLNNTEGNYEIGITKDNKINHRFFRGGPKPQ